jgi:thermitase
MLGRAAAAACVSLLVLVSWQDPPPVTGRIAIESTAQGGGPLPHGRVSPPGAATLAPTDPWWGSEWGLAKIGLPALWHVTLGDPGTVIAVVDTGVDGAVPDLAGAVLPGYDVVDGSGDVTDNVGHGSLVAEIAAGRGDDGVGAAGVCWRCRILPVDVAPHRTALASSLADGIRWAADHGADVINVSLVLSAPDAGVAAAVAYAQTRGAVVVAAAGNDGSWNPSYPAAYPGVLGVVATDASDHPYSWSTHGPWAAFAAPGCATVGSLVGQATAFCGSSAAAPLVAGLAGLLWSSGLRSPSRIRSALAATAVRVDVATAAGGRVDAAALAAYLAR